jgi:transposase-like protein
VIESCSLSTPPAGYGFPRKVRGRGALVSALQAVPAARHVTDRYANNTVEADDRRLKARLRPMRGLRRHRSARTIAAGHAFVQNLRRGRYDSATDHHPHDWLRAAFVELATCL